MAERPRQTDDVDEDYCDKSSPSPQSLVLKYLQRHNAGRSLTEKGSEMRKWDTWNYIIDIRVVVGFYKLVDAYFDRFLIQNSSLW